jgi:hypothetical protein
MARRFRTSKDARLFLILVNVGCRQPRYKSKALGSTAHLPTTFLVAPKCAGRCPAHGLFKDPKEAFVICLPYPKWYSELGLTLLEHELPGPAIAPGLFLSPQKLGTKVFLGEYYRLRE